MKLLINILFVFFVLSASVASAEGYYEQQIRVLEHSAAVLGQFHPQIATQLSQYAHDQTLWRDVTKENAAEAEDERAEMLTIEKKRTHIKLLRDAAILLQEENSDLAKELTALADRKAAGILPK